ncbi:helix-turn-helix domain-containing protein [Streptomonospora alba]|uniref:helix-turn-helix domain-containing protein n=1 Tax=Streptomonospora alba TaxID=183763 RepID=UPI00058FF547|nr:helix-turn-helix domain-containing protein [Streptomonospora alba]
MSTIGRTIAAARENAGYTLADLSSRTCIRRTVLGGIENDDFRPCGGDFYARGHIRAVCRELGLDPAELVERYDREHARERTVPAFTDKPVTGRGDEAARGDESAASGTRGRSEAAGGAQEVPRARTEDSEPRPPARRSADAHAAAGAAQQPTGGQPSGAGESQHVGERQGKRRSAQQSGPGAAGAQPARHARHSRSEDRSADEGAVAAAGASGEGDVPQPRRERKPSLLAATIAAARRSWPLLVFVAIAGAAVVTALVAWPEGPAGQSAGAGRVVERAGEGAGDAAPAPTHRQEQAGPAPADPTRPADPADPADTADPAGPADTADPAETDLGTGLSGMTSSERKAEEVHLTVSATERVWVSVTDAEGDNRFSGVLDKGDVRAWTHSDELRLHVGKASAVRLTVNDEHIGRPDTAARVDRFTFSATDLA